MGYSLRELECFIAVAEELSFTRAARSLRLAQPPLSRHVRTLEEKLGARLFDRSGRTVSLTPAGALFYEETRLILPQLMRAGESVRRTVSGENARLRLGFVSAVLSPELVEVLRAFRQRFPRIQLVMQDALPADQLASLTQGSIDGGFIGLPPLERTPGVRFVPWKKEVLMIFVPFDHPLSRRSEVALKELAAEPWVAVSSEAAPAFASYHQTLCADAGFRPRIILESPRAQAVAVMVAAGAGIALLPASLARVVGTGVQAIALKRSPIITHVFAQPARSTSEAMHAFVEMLSEHRAANG